MKAPLMRGFLVRHTEMPRPSWVREDIIAALGDEECFRALLAQELETIRQDTGYRLLPDAQFEQGVTRVVADYNAWLQMADGRQAAGSDGAVAAVRKLYHLFHTHLHPAFEPDPSISDANMSSQRLLSLSGRGLLAHNFCLLFLRAVAWFHFEIRPRSDDDEWDAVIDTTVRYFETQTNHSFEQIMTRVMVQRGYSQRPVRA